MRACRRTSVDSKIYCRDVGEEESKAGFKEESNVVVMVLDAMLAKTEEATSAH